MAGHNKSMVYVAGILGFILGFFAGQMLLLKLLANRSNKDILNDKTARLTYGLLNWIIAGVGAYVFVFLYNYYLT